MDFTLSEHQQLIRDSARALLAERASRGRLRAALDAGAADDPALWRAMGREMGWLGVAIPEHLGGSGQGWVELAILMEETGRALAFAPFFPTAGLAAPLILAAGDAAQQAAWLPRIAAGELRAAACVTNAAGDPPPDGAGVELRQADDGWRLSGEAQLVAHGSVADLLVVAARTPGTRGWAGLSLLAIAPSTPAVIVQRTPSLDLTRPFARVVFADVAVSRDVILGDPGEAGSPLRQTLDVASVLLAAEQLGGAEAVLEMSVEHAKHRSQFGRPIGSFQAVKHKLADMMLWAESARSAVYYAACVCDEAPDDLPEAAAVARVCASEAYFHCAAEAIQIHGGVGFTWEHDAHLHFRRARASATLLGEVAHHRERVAKLIGLGDGPMGAAA